MKKLQSALLVLTLVATAAASTNAQTATSRAIPLSTGRIVVPAQDRKVDPNATQAIPVVDPTTGQIVVSPAAAAPTTNVPVPRTRMQAITELQVDRRPSRILEVWSTSGQSDVERPPSPLGREMAKVQWDVMMGQWDGLGSYLGSLEDADEAKEIYQALLGKLAATPSTGSAPVHPAGQAFREKNILGIDDIVGLIQASPAAHDEDSIQMLGRLLRGSTQTGNTVDLLLAELDLILEDEDAENVLLERRQAAQLLHGAGLNVHLEPYLPSVEVAINEDDSEALNLLSNLFLARHAKERDPKDLEEAWRLTQAVLASESADEESQQNALTQAVSLSSTVRDELGQEWLDSSFSDDAERGMKILANVGRLTSQGLMTQPTNPVGRMQNLKLLTTSVDSLLANAPEQGQAWQESLTLLAMAWMQESTLAYGLDRSSSRGPIMRYDQFGNPYFMDENQMLQMQQGRQNQPRAVPVADLLKYRPSDEWIALLDESLQPRFEEWLAKLFLKVQEEDNAFPYIERLASSQPEIAEELVNEFLSVWANNHDPNTGRRLRSPIFAIYGFSQRAEGIPLTRSKQERNLQELSEWIERLKALPIGDEIDERLLVRAFTVCHSSAEVYELESIEAVFGDIENLDPVTIAGLAQRMRTNLAGLWREPDVQKQSGTNRRKKDIEAEVLRGYIVANQVIDDALAKHEGDWALMLAQAALMHDEVNYKQEIAKSSSFTESRLAALAAFRAAAQAYTDQLPDMEEDEESTEVFELWFYASLGACDVRNLDSEKLPILSEPPLIRDAINNLPQEAAERHMSKFANSLFTTLRSVGPTVKFRYLKNGFEIVGDHEQALEAKKVFDYYDDLVTEIELHAQVDGSTNVGSDQPFGIFVHLRHTREIERESGGFGRYLQNQNNVQYSYNYGRPTENYRDKFEDGLREALGEHFEIESVTFQSEDVTSKADEEYGWRTTSYAYVLAKARGNEVDRIPPIRLDLDFLDTSGYVVLPIESPMVPIDATSNNADSRPTELISVIQTLDERQANKGKLILEIKATAHGLTPDLEDLVNLKHDGFEIESIDDQGVSVSRFDPEADETVVVTERLWTITLQGRTDLSKLPDSFSFATVIPECDESLFQRYVDADLESVAQTVDLESSYGKTDATMFWVVSSLCAVGLVGLLGLVFILTRRKESDDSDSIHLPHEITPFSVIGVLREIHRTNGLNPEQKDRLETDIQRLEGAYFSPQADEDEDLKKVVHGWLKRVKR